MKFNIYNEKIFNIIENKLDKIKTIKNNCDKNGSLEDFINTVNQFNDMAENDVTYFCTKIGKLYIDKNHNSGYNENFTCSFEDVFGYGIEEGKLVLYTSYIAYNNLECNKLECNKKGNKKYYRF